jgi:chromosome segregation ATPase
MNRKKVVPMTAKNTTKKVTKKPYPKSKRITLDDLAAVVANTDARIAKAREETDARIAKAREETERMLQRLTENVDKLSADGRKTYAIVRELSQNMGGLNTSFGCVVELVVIPKLRSAINTACGFTFSAEKVLVDKDYIVIMDGEKKPVGEIDMFLLDDTNAMAVEIKAQLNPTHVANHIAKLEKLRVHQEKAGIVGKKLFGAMAGIYIDPKAKTLALEKGLYIVEIREEEDKLNVERPEEHKTW